MEEVSNLGTKEKESEILTPSRELSAAYRAARKRFALFGRLYYFRHCLFREPTSADGVTRQETANRIFSQLIIPYVNRARGGILRKVVKHVTIWFTSRFFIYPLRSSIESRATDRSITIRIPIIYVDGSLAPTKR